MNIEIVEFYQIERNDKKQLLKGSLHVYLIDLDIDLRGVHVSRRKDSWFFGLPVLYGNDPDTGERVKFPVFSFTSREKMKELRDLIIQKGKDYILNHALADSEQEVEVGAK